MCSEKSPLTLIGPFAEAVTMEGLPSKGPIDDSELAVISQAGVLIENDRIKDIGSFAVLQPQATYIHQITEPLVLLPGFIDAHTHICFAGDRAGDYALRLYGFSYEEIAARGGGILDTVHKTRLASQDELSEGIVTRVKEQLSRGVTTCEVKSGYGLTVEQERKMLLAIAQASSQIDGTLVPTCLAAHVCPPEFSNRRDYLNYIVQELFPILQRESLSQRIDIYVDRLSFSVEEARFYLQKAKEARFSLCLHANQFSQGGAQLAAEMGAKTADHLEICTRDEAENLAKANVATVVLPGASLGLGQAFAPARMLLDSGNALVIASDWNPGSAPMGQLLLQAAVLGAAQKLSMAETLSAITVRAARALGLDDRGVLAPNMRADLVAFPTDHYQNILYYQGSLQPSLVIVGGKI